MRAAGYVRVSTDTQAESGYGLPEQRVKLEDYCQRRGYNLVEMVADEGVSGRLQDRPGLSRILSLADSGAVDCVVIAKIDPLGRSNRVVQQALYDLRNRGVRIEFSEHASGESASDRLLLNTLAGISEYELENIRERTMNGRMRKAKTTGRNPNGVAPFGFRAISKAEALVLPEFAGRDGEYLVVEEQARWVREMFTQYARGATLWDLQKMLVDARVPTPSGREWSRSTINRLLRNPAFVGRPIYHRLDFKKVETSSGVKETRRVRPESEWVELTCMAIVTEDLFAAVQARMDAQREAGAGRPSTRWALRGCVFCSVCATDRGGFRSCVGHADLRLKKPSRWYKCTSHTERGIFCGCRHNAEELEELARIALNEAAAAGALAGAARYHAEQAAKTAGDPATRIKDCRKGLEQVDAEEAKLLDLALAGFSPKVITTKQAELAAKRDRLQKEVAGAQGLARKMEAPETAAARGELWAQWLREALADPDRFAEMARALVKITLYTDRDPLIEVRVPATMPPG